MKLSHTIGKEPSLQKIVIASAILHLLFITVVAVPIKPKERDFRTYFVNLVGPVQTPGKAGTTIVKKRERRIVPKKKITTPKKTSRARPEPKTDMSLESVNRVAKEIERIRAISSLSKRKRDRKKTQEVQISRKEGPGESAQREGIPGRGSAENTDFYFGIISRKIWQQWVYPELDSSGLEVVISIRIGKDGKVTSQEIEKASGNMLFDRSATKAISRASPLPPPPAGEMEIGVRFYL